MSGLQDGFGDDLTIEEYIQSNERLLKIKAAERTRGSEIARDIWDDLLQEGRIVQWTVLAKRPSSERSYVSAAMTNRMKECISRGTWTGLETHQGRPRDPLRRPATSRSSVDDETLQLDQVVDQADWVEQVLVGYHDGEIAQALDQLTFTQRRHVVARFWYGMTNAEIALQQGCSKQTVERQWRTEIRPRLVAQLGHLASLD
jgi:RNA polymerase sigma factor (sigma-70 family)